MMEDSRLSMVLLLCLTVWGWGAEKAPERAEPRASDAAALQSELRRLVGQLRELRQDYYTRKQAQEERIDEAAEQIKSLERAKTALAPQKAQLESRVKTLLYDLAQLESERESDDALRSAVAEALRQFVHQQRAAIEGGLPHRVEERLQLLHRLDRDLEKGHAKASTLVELAWLFGEGELRDAASGATYSAEVALPDGRRKPARFCHLGHVLVGFLTEDGHECGYAAPTPDGFVWSLESQDSRANVIRSAVRVLDRREPPRLLLLPLTIQSKEERAGD